MGEETASFADRSWVRIVASGEVELGFGQILYYVLQNANVAVSDPFSQPNLAKDTFKIFVNVIIYV